MTTLTALSPLDGRYEKKLCTLQPLLSEYGLIRERLAVEIDWLFCLCAQAPIQQMFPVPKKFNALQDCLKQFTEATAEKIKSLESITKHDVKAVEYYLQDYCAQHVEWKPLIPLIHFGCTSEDINNLAYARLLERTKDTVLLPLMEKIVSTLSTFGKQYAEQPMLSRTHGQPATPTTLGKEFANFVHRLQRPMQTLKTFRLPGKCNGAVGNFNAHHVAFPEINWPAVSQAFVESMGLAYQSHTTQIEPHDGLAECFHALIRFNNILLDFSRDMWGYISLGYFEQTLHQDEVGSSTMPHKINPIDFENAEGNLGLSNALADHLANKLTQSRFQRDLSDSTVMRNIGCVFGYAVVAYESLLHGCGKLKVNDKKLREEVNQHWEVLGEAIQTVMRKHGITDAYEQLKAHTRGKVLNAGTIHQLIDELQLPAGEKAKLKKLTPEHYLGYAATLAKQGL